MTVAKWLTRLHDVASTVLAVARALEAHLNSRHPLTLESMEMTSRVVTVTTADISIQVFSVSCCWEISVRVLSTWQGKRLVRKMQKYVSPSSSMGYRISYISDFIVLILDAVWCRYFIIKFQMMVFYNYVTVFYPSTSDNTNDDESNI